MTNKLIELSLGLTALLSGLLGGIGFFTFMGGNPAVSDLSSQGFAEYWQNIDKYMAARMPVFGICLLLSLVLSLIILSREWKSPSFWLMLIAFIIIIADIVFTLSQNHPLNKMIQQWDLNNLPADVQSVKEKVVSAFNIRGVLMVASFVLVLASVLLRKR